MANRTVKDAHSIKGTNPQYLVEKIIRTRIYECRFWKEECFALTAALMVDKAMELKYLGGVYSGNVKPTDFLCLILKMLQIQPEKDIVVEFIKNEDYKYVRALGAIYMRLTGTSLDCYKYLEPLYLDYRKMKRMNRNGEFEIIYMDELIDELLREERVIDIILPRLQKRIVLEDSNELEPRVSPLEEDLEDMDTSEDEDIQRSPSPERHTGRGGNYKDIEKPNRSPSPPKYKRSRSRSPHRRDRHKHRSRSRDKDRAKEKRHRSPGRKHKEDDDRHRRSKKSKRDRHHRDEGRHKDRGDRNRDKHDKDRSRHKDKNYKDQSIEEANDLRAKLGLAPLK